MKLWLGLGGVVCGNRGYAHFQFFEADNTCEAYREFRKIMETEFPVSQYTLQVVEMEDMLRCVRERRTLIMPNASEL